MGLSGIKSNAQQTVQKSTGTLTVVVTNFRNNQGMASISLYKQANGFPNSAKAAETVFLKIDNTKAIAVFGKLPAGEYAVSVYHDENNNKKLDTNFFGIPKEGLGASNNARSHFGPPKYADAKFTFSGSSQQITLSMYYL